ncbi:MAG: hypothetical protein ABEJ73_12770 [Haloplanus sp.]
MSDVVDTLAILGILLVAVWVGFAIMAVQWVLNRPLVVVSVVAVAALVVVAAVRHRQD